MSYNVFYRHIGKQCKVTTMLGEKVSGKLLTIEDNWMELQTSGTSEFLNTKYIERVKLLAD
jgi:hypothetical protein